MDPIVIVSVDRADLQDLEGSTLHTQFGASNDLPYEQPSVARMYDYLLGGYHNVASDRAAADAAVAIHPDFPLVLHANRAFLRRSVAFLVAQGIDQFLDLGSGIPTVGNVHEVAHAFTPAARRLRGHRPHRGGAGRWACCSPDWARPGSAARVGGMTPLHPPDRTP